MRCIFSCYSIFLDSFMCLILRNYVRCCKYDATKGTYCKTPPPIHIMAPSRDLNFVKHASVTFSSDFFLLPLVRSRYGIAFEYSAIDIRMFSSSLWCMWDPLKMIGSSITDLLIEISFSVCRRISCSYFPRPIVVGRQLLSLPVVSYSLCRST